LVLAGWLAPSMRADATRPKIAVLGIEARDATDTRSRQRSAGLARTLTAELRARADANGYELVQGAVKDLIELKLLSDCIDENPTCMTVVARQLGADVLVYGHLERQRGSYSVSLYRLETATHTVRALDVPKVTAATDEGMRKVAAAVVLGAAVDVPIAEPPRLLVKTSVPATIYVNGVPRGSTADDQPLTVNDLSAGTTHLAVEAPGTKRWDNAIDVQPHGKTEVTVTLEPIAVAPPIVPPATPTERAERPGKTARVLFWTSLVATGAGVAAFTITGLQVRSIEKEQDQAIAEWGDGFKTNGVQFPHDACAEARNDKFAKLVDICDRGQNMATVTNVLMGVTAAAAVATAIFYWRGYLATSDAQESVRSAKLTRPVITPEVYKNGAGLGAVIQF
jgi:hypothetical protein